MEHHFQPHHSWESNPTRAIYNKRFRHQTIATDPNQLVHHHNTSIPNPKIPLLDRIKNNLILIIPIIALFLALLMMNFI